MAAPIHLFVDTTEAWSETAAFGPAGSFRSATRLSTTGAGKLFAASLGKLTIRPAGALIAPPDLDMIPPGPGTPLPASVTLYLHAAPFVRLHPQIAPRIQSIGELVAFVYRNVETASLEPALGAVLDNAILLPAAQAKLARAQVVELLVRGHAEVGVAAGQQLGVASTSGAAGGTRTVGLGVLSAQGPVDPSYVYDRLRDAVEGGQTATDAYLGIAPERWPILDPADPTGSIAATATNIYAWSVLAGFRAAANLTRAQWRQVGDNQKALLRPRLLRRAGQSWSAPRFEFDDADAVNLFQLEAIVEFYANFDDPWKPNAVPRAPTDSAYRRVDFIPLSGQSAEVADPATPAVLSLGSTVDLQQISANGDLVRLDGDTARPATKLYEITKVEPSVGTVTLDAAPTLPAAGSAWRILPAPTLVLIDAFGGRVTGTSARTLDPTIGVVELDIPPGNPNPLALVNPGFDTIYLEGDDARSSGVYRILARNLVRRTVTLDAIPDLQGQPSRWQIPAGLAGELAPALVTYEPTSGKLAGYRLGPGGKDGFDHYDGMLFLVADGAVAANHFRWTSYSSRSPLGPDKKLREHAVKASIRGNHRYDVRSVRSGESFKNFCFKVVEPGSADDKVDKARFYFDPVVSDAQQRLIRLHDGSFGGNGSGSDGCVVSTLIFQLRQELIRVWQGRRVLQGLKEDPDLTTLAGTLDRRGNKKLFDGGKITDADWNNKVRATLWLVRPDELQVGGP